MKHILIDSGWCFLLKDIFITTIDYVEDLINHFQFIQRPISFRCYRFCIRKGFNLNALEKILKKNQFQYVQFYIFINDPLVWSILADARTKELSIFCDNADFKHTIQTNFESFAFKSPVLRLAISYEFVSPLLQFAHLFKNLETFEFYEVSEISNIDLNEIHKRCPNLRSIVCSDLYNKIIEMHWQMDEMAVCLDNHKKSPLKHCKKLSIELYASINYYFDLNSLRNSLISLTFIIDSHIYMRNPQFMYDFLKDNKTLKDFGIELGHHNLDLLPSNLDLNRFFMRISGYPYYYNLSKFIESQHNLEIFSILIDDKFLCEERLLELIESLKNNLILRSIEIEFDFKFYPFHSNRFIKLLQHFQGRDLMINVVPIDSIIRDVNPKKIPKCVLKHIYHNYAIRILVRKGDSL